MRLKLLMRVSVVAGMLAAVGADSAPAVAGPYVAVGDRAQARQEIRQQRQGFRQDVRQRRQGVRQNFRQQRRATRQEFQTRGVYGAPRVRQQVPTTRRGLRQERRLERRAYQRQLRQAERRAIRRARTYDRGRFTEFYRGDRLPRYAQRWIDHRTYALPRPQRGYGYARVNNDILLVALATGVIVDILR